LSPDFVTFIPEKQRKNMTLVDAHGRAIKPTNKPQVMNNTNAQLYQLFVEWGQLNRGLLGALLASKLREFYKNNHLRYQSILEGLSRIEHKYFEQKEDENATFGKRTLFREEEVNGKKAMVPVLLEGMTLEGYEKEKQEFLNEPTVIVF